MKDLGGENVEFNFNKRKRLGEKKIKIEREKKK